MIEVIDHHAETGLPIFAPATPLLIYPADFKVAAKNGQDEFLRTTAHANPERLPILELLAKAEEGFERIEELCQVDVIDHTFGLFYYKDIPKVLRSPGGFPELIRRPREVIPGFTLVARVPVIIRSERMSQRILNRRPPQAVRKGFDQYHRERGILVDVNASQCMYGRIRGQEPGWIMTDIEPRLRDPYGKT